MPERIMMKSHCSQYGMYQMNQKDVPNQKTEMCLECNTYIMSEKHADLVRYDVSFNIRLCFCGKLIRGIIAFLFAM